MLLSSALCAAVIDCAGNFTELKSPPFSPVVQSLLTSRVTDSQLHCCHPLNLLSAIGNCTMTGCWGSSITVFGSLTTALVLPSFFVCPSCEGCESVLTAASRTKGHNQIGVSLSAPSS